MFDEKHLEEKSLTWLSEAGWDYLYGPDISPGSTTPYRGDYREVILKDTLLEALKELNPTIPSENLETAINEVINIRQPLTERGNLQFHNLLLNGIETELIIEGEKRGDFIHLIDFVEPWNNKFLAVNQFTVKGDSKTCRPDIVLFVNGLPLGVIELKNPLDENRDIWQAFEQVNTYKQEVPELFTYNEVIVISDGYNARAGSLTAGKERFFPWRFIENENDNPLLEMELEKMIRGLFDQERFIDYLRYFILFETPGDKVIKKIAAYHQFYAAREAVRVTLIASARPQTEEYVSDKNRATYGDEVNPGNQKAGVVWHTQGSGKSITMLCYVRKLIEQQEMENPTIVMVTDRNSLDGQLYDTFNAARDYLKNELMKAESRIELRDFLSKRATGGIVFTTVQKFSLTEEDESDHPVLNKRRNIIVISDEAHRSQYGLQARYSQKKQKYLYGFARHMRTALPHACFLGFTGTPISIEDKDTRSVFGDYISIYDIQAAVEDGATVPIYYQARMAKLLINRQEIDQLDEQVEEIIEDEEDVVSKERQKSSWTSLEKLVGATPRLEEMARDILTHFDERNSKVEGKGMIVCMSRAICVQLYNVIIRFRPEWHNPDHMQGSLKIIMTGSTSERREIKEHVYSKSKKKDIEKRFKNPKDPLKVVIVRDMWLTGFDAPCLHTMYVDKPMKDHNLMQSIARVNRIFPGKSGGLIVDYIGISHSLTTALRNYTAADGKGDLTIFIQETFLQLKEKINILRGIFHEFDYSTFKNDPAPLFIDAANYLLGIKDGKKRFFEVMAYITQAYSLCSSLDEAREYDKEIAFFSALRAILLKSVDVNKKWSQESKESALKQILDNSIVADGVADIWSLMGKDQANISLLSDEFLDEVRALPARNLAAELLARLLKDQIRASSGNNLVQERKYSEHLEEALRKYHNRLINTTQVIDELIKMAKEYRADLENAKSLGLNPDEVAFYYALAENESAVRELGSIVLKRIAVEITEKLRNSTTTDWQCRENIRAKLRNLVRRILRKWRYPPDKQNEAVELVLKQAERLADQWSR